MLAVAAVDAEGGGEVLAKAVVALHYQLMPLSVMVDVHLTKVVLTSWGLMLPWRQLRRIQIMIPFHRSTRNSYQSQM
jgi:hypothetical protein